MQKGKSRNVLASPLGEEGHEVAKGCTRVRMIMILDVDVTAERRHYNTYRPAGDTTTLGPKGRRPLSASEHNPPPSSGHNPRGEAPSTLTPKACPRAIRNPRPERPSNLRTLRPSGRSILRTLTPKVCLKAERLQSKMPAIFSWQAFGFAALFQADRIGIRLIVSGTSLLTF